MAELQDFQSLLLASGAGDDQAASDLLLRYGPAVVVAVRRVLAKEMRSRFDSADFAQAVWASFFANRSQLETIQNPQELIRLLCAMAHNKVVDEFRRRCLLGKNNVNLEQPLDEDGEFEAQSVADAGSSPSQHAVANELWQRFIADMAPQERAILELRRNGFRHDEIAARFGISKRTVARVINRVFKEQTSC